MTRCPSLDWVAAWALGEVEEAEAGAFEEHYFGCERCADRARRLHETVELVGRGLPIALTRGRRSRAERDPHLFTVRVAPGQRAVMRVGGESIFGIWVLSAPVAGARRIDVEAQTSRGAPLFAIPDAPFDEERGEVVLLCSIHYRGLDAKEMHARVTVTDRAGRSSVAEYVLQHDFL